MRTIFSTPVTPTRDRLTWVEGRRAWTSLPRSLSRSLIGRRRYRARMRQMPQVGVHWRAAARATARRLGSAPRGNAADSHRRTTERAGRTVTGPVPVRLEGARG